MNKHDKFTLIYLGMFLIFMLLLIIITGVFDAKAQGLSVSFRDPNYSKAHKFDYEIKLTVLDYKNKYILSLLLERENDRLYQEIRAQAGTDNWQIKHYEKTAQRIKNTDVSYFRKMGWTTFGGSLHRDISGTVSLLADLGIRSKYFTAKFQRGLKTWIVDGELKWSKPISKELFTIWGFKFVPALEVSVKYYQDGYGRIYRQLKFSFNIGAV